MKRSLASLTISTAMVFGLGIMDSEADAQKPEPAVQRSGSCDFKTEVSTWKPAHVFLNMQTGDIVGDGSTANQRSFFSSASKLLPAYITLDLMKNGTGKDRIAEDERISIQHRSYASASKSKYVQGIDPIPASSDEMTPDQILAATFIRSSNDGPNALAMRISGNLKDFYALENEYARRLGMKGNWNSATGFNTADAIKSHWEMPLGMARLMTAAYNEFGDDLKGYYSRSRELHGFKKGSDTKVKFTLKSKIEAFDSDYAHHIKGLQIMKPGFTCFGGIAAVGVVNVEGIDFAFAYAGYRSKEQRDASINKITAQIREDIKSGKIVPVREQTPVQTFDTVKTDTVPQEASVNSSPAPANSTMPLMTLSLIGIFGIAGIGAGAHALTRSKLKDGFIHTSIPSQNAKEPVNYLPMSGSRLLAANPY